jgi:hypothetical protein
LQISLLRKPNATPIYVKIQRFVGLKLPCATRKNLTIYAHMLP